MKQPIEPEVETKQCPHCENGYSPAHQALQKHMNGLMWDNAVRTIPEYAKITEYLCGTKATGFGHDSLDALHAVTRLGRKAGLPEGWETCQTCKGSGEIPVDEYP